ARRALAEPDYCEARLELLNRHDLTVPVLSVDGGAEEMAVVVPAAPRLGVATPSGPRGPMLDRPPRAAPASAQLHQSLRTLVAAWQPVLDACRQAGLRFAAQVQPGQMAFDLHSAAWVLEALEEHEAFGFTFDPAVLHWQGVDPTEFVRRFPQRIYHV